MPVKQGTRRGTREGTLRGRQNVASGRSDWPRPPLLRLTARVIAHLLVKRLELVKRLKLVKRLESMKRLELVKRW